MQNIFIRNTLRTNRPERMFINELLEGCDEYSACTDQIASSARLASATEY